MKILGTFYKHNKSLYVAAVYNSPEYYEYSKMRKDSHLDQFRDKLLTFSESDLVLIGGDFKSSTGTLSYFVIEDERDLPYFPENYELYTHVTRRNNEDISVNMFGEQLIDLCIASKLRILNGRTRGDFQGHFTYVGYNGCSSVDLIIASENIPTQLSLVGFLSVQELNPRSDHKPLLLKLSVDYLGNKEPEAQNTLTMHEAPKRYILNDESLTRFENAVERLKNVEGHSASNNEIEALLYQIQPSLKSAVNSTLRTGSLNIKKPTQKQTNKQKKNQKGFTRECLLRRR